MKIEYKGGWKGIAFIIICLLAFSFLIYFLIDSPNLVRNQAIKDCNAEFGKGNWTFNDTKITNTWWSLEGEFTCISNTTNVYYIEVKNETG
jgi:uncharacterized membrane protein YukC